MKDSLSQRMPGYLLGALLLGLAAAAPAQTVVGGGAAVTKKLFDGTAQTLSSPWSYSVVGSGNGKAALMSNDATLYGLRDENDPQTPVWPAPQPVHFAGTDHQPITQNELSQYLADHGSAWGPLIQVPVFAFPVIFPFKRAGANGLPLTAQQLCGIFSYQQGYRQWGDVLGNSDTTSITVVYRQDANSTTKALSEFLAAACLGYGFVVSHTFEVMVRSAIPALPLTVDADEDGIPDFWRGVQGADALVTEIATDARLGYARSDEGISTNNASKVARVNGYLPVEVEVQQALPYPPSGVSRNNPLSWAPAYLLPSSGYPVYGLAYLIVGQCYINTSLMGEVGEFASLLNQKISLYPLQSVALPSAWRVAIADAFLTSSSPLSIGNLNVCNGRGRP